VDVAQGRDTVSIVVQDDGVGIPEDKLTAIFEQHFRLDRANETRTPGAGLGLYIVREIVEAHGGTIRAESVEGKGTAFYVDLPRRVEGAPLAGQEALSN